MSEDGAPQNNILIFFYCFYFLIEWEAFARRSWGEIFRRAQSATSSAGAAPRGGGRAGIGDRGQGRDRGQDKGRDGLGAEQGTRIVQGLVRDVAGSEKGLEIDQGSATEQGAGTEQRPGKDWALSRDRRQGRGWNRTGTGVGSGRSRVEAGQEPGRDRAGAGEGRGKHRAGAGYQGEKGFRARGWLLGRGRGSGSGRVLGSGRAGAGQGWDREETGAPREAPSGPPRPQPRRTSPAGEPWHLQRGHSREKRRETEGRYSSGCSRPEEGWDGGKQGGDAPGEMSHS